MLVDRDFRQGVLHFHAWMHKRSHARAVRKRRRMQGDRGKVERNDWWLGVYRYMCFATVVLGCFAWMVVPRSAVAGVRYAGSNLPDRGLCF